MALRPVLALSVLLACAAGSAGAAEPAASSAAAPAPTPAENLNAPPTSGELLHLAASTDLGRFKTTQATVRRAEPDGPPALRVEFARGANAYPNVQFPVPASGWNLSAFGGVQVELTNPGAADVTAFLRVDGPGDWQKSPWNTESTKIPAGQTRTLKVTFGQSGGAPGYPVDSRRIVGMQVFLQNPTQDRTTLLVRNLKPVGSPKDAAAAGTAGLFSAPADRTRPVTPPAWSGKRPPVPGEWVQTLNENFDGKTINDKLWSDKTWWNGLLGSQTQRYSKNNLLLQNGILRIKAEKRRGPQYDDPSLPARDYTTGHLITYDKWTQRYGFFEARVKLPTARGLWPAFWMMPDRGPAAGPEGWKRESTKDGGMEIDILEHLTEWGPGRNNVAAHWDGYDADHKQWGTTNVYYGPTRDGWHTWDLLWEPGKLTWYTDGIKKAEFASTRIGSVPAYLILNVQMGGWATRDVDEAKLPDYMEIDYVRAWQLKNRMKP